MSSHLPSISAADIHAAASSFSPSKGYTGFHPRSLSWLSDTCLQSLASLLNSIEAAGQWPTAIMYILLHLIPKRGGGRRPIGLTPAPCRVWERCRKPVVAQWRAFNKRPYDWLAKGRRVEDAVWTQALHDEAAPFSGEASATILIDLAKAFESVPLEQVWRSGIRSGYPHPPFAPLP